jgi:MoaA/NifB/PqqE/SkfB family radical SAM enzyme
MIEKRPFKEFTLQWHITNACQLRCKHCYVDFSKPVALPFETIIK